MRYNHNWVNSSWSYWKYWSYQHECLWTCIIDCILSIELASRRFHSSVLAVSSSIFSLTILPFITTLSIWTGLAQNIELVAKKLTAPNAIMVFNMILCGHRAVVYIKKSMPFTINSLGWTRTYIISTIIVFGTQYYLHAISSQICQPAK